MTSWFNETEEETVAFNVLIKNETYILCNDFIEQVVDLCESMRNQLMRVKHGQIGDVFGFSR